MKDDNGIPIELKGYPDHPLGEGGEGKVYETDRVGFVAKIYDELQDAAKISKLKVMIANPPQNPATHEDHVAIAWPTSLLFESYQYTTAISKCVGFLMPQIGKNAKIDQIYNPSSRIVILPKCNWLFLHTTALNFVEIVESLHSKDYIIGDIKPQNILVDNSALVSIIDNDSFQVVDQDIIYQSLTITPEFTPPELMDMIAINEFLDMMDVIASDIIQTVYHDCYRIALIIYHLLFTKHPFHEGTWQGDEEEPSEIELMKDGIWLYNSQGLLKPNKLTIPLEIIHPRLQALFKRCFNDGHKDPTKRPSAAEWSAALRLAINDLTSCGKVDTHKYSRTYGKCYWCERKNILNVDMFEGELLMPPPPPLLTIKTSSKPLPNITSTSLKPSPPKPKSLSTITSTPLKPSLPKPKSSPNITSLSKSSPPLPKTSSSSTTPLPSSLSAKPTSVFRKTFNFFISILMIVKKIVGVALFLVGGVIAVICYFANNPFIILGIFLGWLGTVIFEAGDRKK